MVDTCEPKYKKLSRIHSFSEQRYATVQLMEQACKNDEWLKQAVERLDYLTHPAIRKRFNPVAVDPARSYGYVTSSDGTILFNNEKSKEINIDLSNPEKWIDVHNSSIKIESSSSDGNIYRIVLPREEVAEYTSFGNYSEGDSIGSYYYIGYNIAKNYEVRPDWLDDWRERDIPAVCRGQTFKATQDGYIESVVLPLGKTIGVGTSNWGSPLYVQIWPCEDDLTEVEIQKWNYNTNTAEGTGETEDIPKPKIISADSGNRNTIYYPLAQGIIHPSFTGVGDYTVQFDQACEVEKDKYYMLVLFSPLSNPRGSCPYWGGWDLSDTSHSYDDGDAWRSKDNGRKWSRYGNNSKYAKTISDGKYMPQDFGFRFNIVDYDEVYESGNHYLYLKPIFSNPVTHIKLTASDNALTSDYLDITYQYSVNNGRTWNNLPNNSKVATGSNSCYILIRAVLSQTSSNNGETPSIGSIHIELTTSPAKEMYVRTHDFNPQTGNMLDANVWGSINAPFECMTKNVKCYAELINQRVHSEEFTVIDIEEIKNYTHLDGVPAAISNLSGDRLKAFVIDSMDLLNVLRSYDIYVKPIIYNNERYNLSFTDGIKLNAKPSYPILGADVVASMEGLNQSYMEWVDFTVDYDTDIITFLDDTVIDNIPSGVLKFSYNEVFLTDITNEEMPLVLDYFEEEFSITDDLLESRTLNLRCECVDPIRHVILNKDSDFETELTEDKDFIVDYNNHSIYFPITNMETETSVLSLSDKVTVVYTPNLWDKGLSIGYYAKRTNTGGSNICKIKPNYIEYKV